MKHMAKQWRKISLIAILCASFTSCNQQEFKRKAKEVVKDFTIKRHIDRNSDVLIVSSVRVNLEPFGIDAIMPAGLRKDIRVGRLGKVGSAYMDENNTISLALNLSTLLNNDYLQEGTTLPNGITAPMIQGNDAFGIPLKLGNVSEPNMMLYASIVRGQVVLGLTMKSKQLWLGDGLSKNKLFVGFEAKGIHGMGGIYLGENQAAGNNGLGVFFDITDLVGYRITAPSDREDRLEKYENDEPTKRELRKLGRALRKLKRKNTKKIKFLE